MKQFPAIVNSVIKLIKFTQIYGQLYKTSTQRIFTQYVEQPYNISILTASLIFIWPIKKINKESSNLQIAPSVLDKADQLFDNGHYGECYELLKNSEDLQNVEVQWRICKALYNMSKESKCDMRDKKNFIYEAFEIISLLVQNHQNHFAVHKWYALLLDAKSSFEGIKERIKQLENVKAHMDIAVILNPNDATLLHMLGEWCYQITEMPWHQRKLAELFFATPPNSSYEDALEYFLRAEAAQPRFFSLNLLRLGYVTVLQHHQASISPLIRPGDFDAIAHSLHDPGSNDIRLLRSTILDPVTVGRTEMPRSCSLLYRGLNWIKNF